MGEIDLFQRLTIPLEFAYPSSSNNIGSYTVSLACIGNMDYVVDVGYLYVSQVGTIVQGSAGPVIAGNSPKFVPVK